jgi:hypothetical protein
MINQHILKNVRLHHTRSQCSPTKASSHFFGKVVDMQGFEGCVFIVQGSSKQMGASAVYQKIAGAPTSSGPFYNLSGTSSTGAWSSNSRSAKTLITDVYKPLSTQRFLKQNVAGSCTDAYLGFFAIQYGMRKPGSSDLWKSSTRAGSTLWNASYLGGQTLAVSPTGTTVTNT